MGFNVTIKELWDSPHQFLFAFPCPVWCKENIILWLDVSIHETRRIDNLPEIILLFFGKAANYVNGLYEQRFCARPYALVDMEQITDLGRYIRFYAFEKCSQCSSTRQPRRFSLPRCYAGRCNAPPVSLFDWSREIGIRHRSADRADHAGSSHSLG